MKPIYNVIAPSEMQEAILSIRMIDWLTAGPFSHFSGFLFLENCSYFISFFVIVGQNPNLNVYS